MKNCKRFFRTILLFIATASLVFAASISNSKIANAKSNLNITDNVNAVNKEVDTKIEVALPTVNGLGVKKAGENYAYTFTFNGSEIYFFAQIDFNVFNLKLVGGNKITSIYDAKAINAGTYKYTLSIKDTNAYKWPEQVTEDIVYTFTIEQKSVLKSLSSFYNTGSSEWEQLESGEFELTYDQLYHKIFKNKALVGGNTTYFTTEGVVLKVVKKVQGGNDIDLGDAKALSEVGKYELTITLLNDNYKWSEDIKAYAYYNAENGGSLKYTFVIKKYEVKTENIKFFVDGNSNESHGYKDGYSDVYGSLSLTFNGKVRPVTVYCLDEDNKISFELEAYATLVGDETNTTTDIKNVGTYKINIKEVKDEDGKSFTCPKDLALYVEVNTLRVRLYFTCSNLEYGFTYNELVSSITKKIDKYDLSDEIKNEILNRPWFVIKEGLDNYWSPEVYTKEELSSIVPGYYDFILSYEDDNEGTPETIYDKEYSVYSNPKDTTSAVNYEVTLDNESYFIVTKKNVEINWTRDNFTYNTTNQFDKVKAYYLDKDGKQVNLVVENTTSNEFKNADIYRFLASFDSTLDTDKDYKQTDLYQLEAVSQKYYTMKKCPINWNNVKFNTFKVKYEIFITNTEPTSYIDGYHDTIENIDVKGYRIVGLDDTNNVKNDEIVINYDLSNVRAYNGKYPITVSLSSDNYLIDEEHQVLSTYFIVGVKSQTIEKSAVENEIAVIEAANEGDILDPTLRLVVETISDNNEGYRVELKNEADTRWTDQVFEVYDVSLIDENNIKMQPDGTLKISLLVPEEIRNGKYEIYHRHTDEYGNVTITKLDITRGEDGYATFTTDSLSEFVFVYRFKSLIWLMITLSILILGSLFLLGYQLYVYLVKTNKLNKILKRTMMFSVVPVFYMPGHVKTVVILAIILGTLLLLNLCALLYIKNALKEKTEDVEYKVLKAEEAKELESIQEATSTTPIKEQVAAPMEEKTLSESMELLNSVSSHSSISKKTICEYLEANHSDDCIVNSRENYTKAAKGNGQGLPLADTHYVKTDAKNICFTYVYENNNGNVLILLKTSEEHIKLLKEKHANIHISKFPKVGEGLKWYSLPIDNTYAFNQVAEMLEESMKINANSSYSPKVSNKIKANKPKKEEWATKVLQEFDNSKETINEDENGIPVVAVFFKNPYNKLYYFKYEDIEYTKGDILNYARVKGDHRKVVVAIPKIKISEDKLTLPLHSLKDNQEA